MRAFEAFHLAIQTIRAQKLKSGFSLLGVFVGVSSLIGSCSIANGVNRYMTEKFAQTIFGVNTFQLRQRPVFNPNVPDSVWRSWRRRPRIRFSDAKAITEDLTVPVITAWQSSDNVSVTFGNKEARDIELADVVGLGDVVEADELHDHRPPRRPRNCGAKGFFASSLPAAAPLDSPRTTCSPSFNWSEITSVLMLSVTPT